MARSLLGPYGATADHRSKDTVAVRSPTAQVLRFKTVLMFEKSDFPAPLRVPDEYAIATSPGASPPPRPSTHLNEPKLSQHRIRNRRTSKRRHPIHGGSTNDMRPDPSSVNRQADLEVWFGGEVDGDRGFVRGRGFAAGGAAFAVHECCCTTGDVAGCVDVDFKVLPRDGHRMVNIRATAMEGTATHSTDINTHQTLDDVFIPTRMRNTTRHAFIRATKLSVDRDPRREITQLIREVTPTRRRRGKGSGLAGARRLWSSGVLSGGEMARAGWQSCRHCVCCTFLYRPCTYE